MAASVSCLFLSLCLLGVLAPTSALALAERFASPFRAYYALGAAGAAAADFNRDGRLDVAIAGGGDGVYSAIVQYGAANGTFVPPSPVVSLGASPSAVAAADMNGDGFTDLVVTRAYTVFPPGVRIVLNTGTGWSATPPSPIFLGDPVDVAVADLNHDGSMDVVTSSTNGDNVSVLLGNGDGTLRGATSYSTGLDPNAIAIEDVNGDGNADVVSATSGEFGITIWYGTGTGTLTSRTEVATAAAGPYDVVIGRFNGDSIPDIATVHPGYGKISILLGLGGTSYAAPTYVSPAYGLRLVASDFNSDGKTDLAYAGGGTPNGAVFLGSGTGTFGTAVPFKDGGYPATLIAGKLHGDSNTDLLVAHGTGLLSVLTGNGDGKFGFDKETAAGLSPRSVAVGDVTGDGKLDAVVSDQGSQAIVVVPGDATWSNPGPPTSYSAAGVVVSVALANVDGDGDVDVVAALQTNPPNNVEVFYNNGAGAFTTHALFTAGEDPRAIAARDCSGDGRPDLFVANGNDGTVSVFLNNGSGGFNAPTTLAPGGETVAILPTNIVGTGSIDLVIADHANDHVLIYSGNGAGSFTLANTLNTPSGPSSLSTGNLNGDGLSDLAVTCTGAAQVAIFINDVDNIFTNVDNIGVGPAFGPEMSIQGADLDADGKGDLVVSDNQLNSVIFIRTTSAAPTFSLPEPLGVGSEPQGIAISDLDGDADQDILVANYQQPSLQILKNSGPVTPPDLAPSVLAVPGISVEAKGILSFTVTASDGDGNAISSLTASPLPTGATFTPNGSNTSGVFAWVPTTTQVGTYTITFTAANILSGSAKTVIHVDPYATQANGTFLWVPQTADIGVHTIRFRAANTRGDPAATESTVITVSPPSAMAQERMASRMIQSPEAPMKGPIISAPPSYGTTVGDTVVIAVSANDTDSLTANTSGTSTGSNATFANDLDPVVHAPTHVNAPRGVLLSFTVTVSDPDGDAITSLTADLSSLPAGNAMFTPGMGNTSGVFTWTPAMTDSGTFGVIFIAANKLVGVGATVIHVNPGGPVSYWKLNGNGQDEIGKVNLNPIGTPVYATAKLKQGIVLDGTGANGLQAVATPDHNVQGSWTVECWVNAGPIQAQDRILLAAQDNPGDNYWFIGVTALGQAWFQIYQDGTFTSDMRSTTIVTDGTFHHVALTTNGTTMTLYVDGVVQTTSTQMAACLVSGGAIAVGANIAPARSGTVDELRIWNVVRTQTQIQAAMNAELSGFATAVEDGPSAPVYRNVLRQNAPNPFNPHTEIRFELAKAGPTSLRIYDVRGRLVATLIHGVLRSGPHEATWSGADGNGRDVASGVYFYRLESSGFTETHRMTLAR